MTTSLVTNDSPLFLTKVTVTDANYATTLTNGLLIAYTALTAPKTVTLPPATTSGQIVTVVDESGSCSPTNTITIVGAIDGATNKTLNAPYSAITLESNGAGGYAILSKNDNLDAITKDPTGFSDPAVVTETYDSTNRTVTLTGNFSAYWRGELVPVLTNGWVSPAHPATAGPWFLFYNGTSFVWQQTPWTFDMLLIAYVNYGATDKFALRECHGLMPWQSHQEFHQTIGTYSTGGGDLSSYVLSSTTVADRRPAVSSPTIHDEDLTTVVTALPAAGPYTQLYLTSTGTSTFATAAAEIVPVSGSHPYYNQFTSGNWVQTLMSNFSCMSIWLVAVPTQADPGSQAYRYLWIQGQTNGSLASEQATQFKDLNLGQLSSLFTEFVVIDKIIIQYTAANWTIQEVDKLTGNRVNPGSTPAGSYLSAVSVTAPLTGNGTPATPLAIPAATASVDGYLASTDWTTFNSKQAAYTILTTFGSLANATGFLKNDGTGVLSYDNTPQNTALWGSITGASAQAAPAGGWTGNHGAMSMSALTATTGTFSGGITSILGGTNNGGSAQIINSSSSAYGSIVAQGANGNGLPWWPNSFVVEGVPASSGNTVISSYTGSLIFQVNNRNINALTLDSTGAATFASSVSMAALSATTGTFSATGGDTKSLVLSAPQPSTYATDALTSAYGKIAFNWYSDNWTIAANRGGGFDARSLTFSRNGTNALILNADLSAAFASSVSMAALSATSGTFSGSVSQTPVAFASLPAGSAGMRHFVNNNSASAAFGSDANGSGSTTYPVYHDGVSWKIG